MRLKNKIAIVTGGGSGFGAGIVKKFIQEGAKVVVADINFENAKKVAMDTGGFAVEVDVSNSLSFKNIWRILNWEYLNHYLWILFYA